MNPPTMCTTAYLSLCQPLREISSEKQPSLNRMIQPGEGVLYLFDAYENGLRSYFWVLIKQHEQKTA